MPCAPFQETLAKDKSLTGAQAVRYVSEFPEWTKFEKIIATLVVTVAAAGAGDTLIARLQTRPGEGYEWINLGSAFTTVLGNDAEPIQYTLPIVAGQSTWWHREISVLVTLAGGTAAFTFSVRIEANA